MHDLRSVEADLARGRCNDADEQAAQRALAGGGRANDRNGFAWHDFKADMPENDALTRPEGDIVDHEMPLWRGKLNAIDFGREVVEAGRQTRVADPRGAEIAPSGHRHLDRRQCATQQDRGRDHRAGAELTMNDQMGARAKNENLRKKPSELRDSQENSATLRARGSWPPWRPRSSTASAP
jgi:hypothetical protein